MEEETQKRNTDCLYFLASPFTCKKGSECEYRHSDSARLNPRDCWYWLNGSCHNPNCAFRHPPLQGFNGVKAESFYTPSSSAVPISKSNVPCYFYYNSICAKGGQCPFLHETFPAQKSLPKPVPESAAPTNPPLENKISTGDTGPASVELPTESIVGPTRMDPHHPHPPKEASRSPSVDSIVPEFEEPPAGNFLPSSVGFMDRRAQLSPYPSSEELVKECVDQELDERWESSPGFDVLVDDGSEHMEYEDDAEYHQLVQNRESELCRSHLLDYDFEEHSGYPDTGFLYDRLYGDYKHTDDIYAASSCFRKVSELPREERAFIPMYDNHGKQRVLRRVHRVQERDDVMDMHDHVGKHMRMDDGWLPFNSRKRFRRSNSSTRRGMTSNGSIQSRLTSQVGSCMITAYSHDEYGLATRNHHGWQGWRGQSGNGRSVRSRTGEKERRRHRFPLVSSEVQRSSSARDEEECARIGNGGFEGPKTLAQIKEEKRRPNLERIESSLDRRRRRMAADFEGPKPLEELLRHKRSEGPRMSVCPKLEHFDSAGCHADFGGDDDDDDDDVFRRKLVHVLSQ